MKGATLFIDIHAHAYRMPFFQVTVPKHEPWPNAGQLVAFYDTLGVEKAVLLPLIGPEFYLPQSNEDILEAAEQYPGRFIPFCNIHPRAINNDPHSPLEDVLSQYKAAGCKGIGEVTCNMPFADPFMQNLFRAAQLLEMPLTFHLGCRKDGCYGIIDEPGLPGLEETLQRYPKLQFLGHSTPFWSEISVLSTPGSRAGYPKGKVEEGVLAKLLRRYQNLNGDLSAGSGANALTRDPEYAVKFLHEFQDQLFFGIDICSPPRDSHRNLADFLVSLKDQGKISPAIFRKVARENAIRLLHL